MVSNNKSVTITNAILSFQTLIMDNLISDETEGLRTYTEFMHKKVKTSTD
jgi:hypothetical protein